MGQTLGQGHFGDRICAVAGCARSSDVAELQVDQITSMILDRKGTLDPDWQRITEVLEAKRQRC